MMQRTTKRMFNHSAGDPAYHHIVWEFDESMEEATSGEDCVCIVLPEFLCHWYTPSRRQ